MRMRSVPPNARFFSWYVVLLTVSAHANAPNGRPRTMLSFWVMAMYRNMKVGFCAGGARTAKPSAISLNKAGVDTEALMGCGRRSHETDQAHLDPRLPAA